MEKVYQHTEIEKKWYEKWEKSGYFKPDPDTNKRTFTIILPPPNANANLHLGHAMMSVEDILIRYHRMKGDACLWLPGADHAGFETQFVFEKHLNKEGKSRFDYSREELYKMIWDFVHKNRSAMENQLRRLGFSLDWSRNIFTLDPKIIKVVYKTFKKLYDDGIAYRSERLVNYCVKDGTSFSDLEVNDVETEGNLYFINFPLLKGGFIPIATTRPETILGDAAVMVNPKDKRYKHLIGETVVLPISNRHVPIIADEYVDMKFGTGAVKVTPNHDLNDFEIGKKHKLYYPPVIGFNGRMTNTNTDYDGLKALEARTRMLGDDRIKNLIVEIKNHKMVTKNCYKCGRVLEPLPLSQWYIEIKSLSQKAVEAIKKKKITFAPKRQEKTAISWLTHFHDWNISRQIVWGIRIPAWQCADCKEWTVTEGEIPVECLKCKSLNLTQDTDTFDTWFSSGQWPFATLKANSEKDFERFYPTSVMETGYDILPWWVCRMIMLGIYITGKEPFDTVCLHGLIRDAKGQKMSKSKGNVINPLEMVDKYGADALRFSLVYGTAFGNDVPMSEDKIRGMRNFSNKLWNICRFLKMNIENYKINNIILPNFTTEGLPLEKLSKKDQLVFRNMNILQNKVTKAIEKSYFDKAANDLYEYIWHKYADKLIEERKDKLKNFDLSSILILNYSFLQCLKLLHPFMPFITEEIAIQLGNKKPLIISDWPKSE